MQFFGDSYDIVKRFLLKTLAPELLLPLSASVQISRARAPWPCLAS